MECVFFLIALSPRGHPPVTKKSIHLPEFCSPAETQWQRGGGELKRGKFGRSYSVTVTEKDGENNQLNEWELTVKVSRQSDSNLEVREACLWQRRKNITVISQEKGKPRQITNCCSASVQWPALADSDLSGQLPVELYECQSIAVKEHACSVDCPCINKCLTRLKVYSPASSPLEAIWLIIPNNMQKFCQIWIKSNLTVEVDIMSEGHLNCRVLSSQY